MDKLKKKIDSFIVAMLKQYFDWVSEVPPPEFDSVSRIACLRSKGEELVTTYDLTADLTSHKRDPDEAYFERRIQGISGIKLHGDWQSCSLYVNNHIVDTVYNDFATEFDVTNRKRKRFLSGTENIKLVCKKKNPCDKYSIDYEVVLGKVAGFHYIFRQHQECLLPCTTLGPQRLRLGFSFPCERIIVYYEDDDYSGCPVADVQLVYCERDSDDKKTVSLIHDCGCFIVDFEDPKALPHFSYCDDIFLQFTNERLNHTLRVYARTLNVFSTRVGCGVVYRS